MKIVHKNLKQGEMKQTLRKFQKLVFEAQPKQVSAWFDQKELLVRIREDNNRCFANANMEISFSDIFTKSLKKVK